MRTDHCCIPILCRSVLLITVVLALQGMSGFAAELAPELKSIAFSLEPGKISPVIETPDSFHLIKVKDQHPGKAESSDAPGVRDAIKKLMYEGRRQTWKADYLKQLKEKLEDGRR